MPVKAPIIDHPKALFLVILEAMGQEIRTIEFIRDFVAWIPTSDLLRFRLSEPIIGGLAEYPADAEMLGIKTQPVYTASICHLDVECSPANYVVTHSRNRRLSLARSP